MDPENLLRASSSRNVGKVAMKAPSKEKMSRSWRGRVAKLRTEHVEKRNPWLCRPRGEAMQRHRRVERTEKCKGFGLGRRRERVWQHGPGGVAKLRTEHVEKRNAWLSRPRGEAIPEYRRVEGMEKCKDFGLGRRRERVWQHGLVCLLACCLWEALSPPAASAEQTEKFAYDYKQVWSAAVRLLRVDLGHAVSEKDEDVGFIVFEVVDSAQKKHRGTAQLATVQEEGREVIRVELSIRTQPSYVEIMILNKLRRKLSEEYGEPRPPKKKPEPTDPEAPADEDKSKDKGKEREGNPGKSGGDKR